MVTIVVSMGVAAYIYYLSTKINLNELNFFQKFIIKQVLNKWKKYVVSIPKEKHAIMDYDTMFNMLNKYERYLIKQILTINPQDIGFKGPFYSLESANNLVKIDSVGFIGKGEGRETGVQYCPEHSYIDFKLMAEKIKEEENLEILIDSGYRSSGRQAYLFVLYLVEDNDFCLKENGKWIALPGYSEHGSPVNNAIDIVNQEGINGFSENQTAEDFEKTKEYEWLVKNASEFNFYLSYPKNNSLGVAYEPWHWHWEKK